MQIALMRTCGVISYSFLMAMCSIETSLSERRCLAKLKKSSDKIYPAKIGDGGVRPKISTCPHLSRKIPLRPTAVAAIQTL
jgi:hypothetical protein